jgi:hypothetical protein
MKTCGLLVTVVLLLIAGSAQADWINPEQSRTTEKSLLSLAETGWRGPVASASDHWGAIEITHGWLPRPCTGCDLAVFVSDHSPSGKIEPERITPGRDNRGSDVVPEPSTFLLLGSGILGLAAAARRKLLAHI